MIRPRGIGKKKQKDSPSSNLTQWLTRVNAQFMVNENDAQSVSTTPVRAEIPSLGAFGGPVTQRSYPSSDRKTKPTKKVRIPEPK